MTTKVLLFGGFGLLGHDIYTALTVHGFDVIRHSKEELNLLDRSRLTEAIHQIKPGVIVNAAGYTNVDESERQPQLAYDHNCTAVFNLSCAIMDTDIKLIQFSTDYVFDGAKSTPYQEEATRNPINFYGLSKKIGEDLVVGLNENHYLIRSSWLYGHQGHCFPKTIIRTLEKGSPLNIVNDQIGSPTFTEDLSLSILHLIRNPDIPFGTYHITNGGETDWYSFAVEIAKEAGLSNDLIVPIESEKYETPAKRPKYTVLDSSKWNGITNQPMDSYRYALHRFMTSHIKKRWR